MWEVWYDLEASNDLADNGSLVAPLFFKCESLAENNGWPVEGEYEQDEGLIFWHQVGHLIVYRRLEELQVVQIAVLMPE